MPALSSDSDKDGEDEGNDEDELRGLQSFHIQSDCNTERDSGINGRGTWAELEENGMDMKGGRDERHWLRDNKVWAERERPKQKQMDRYQSVMWRCPLLHLKRGAFQSFLSRNTVVKLASLLLVPTGYRNFELVFMGWGLQTIKNLQKPKEIKRSPQKRGLQRCLKKLKIEIAIINFMSFYHRWYSVLEQIFFPSLWEGTAL